MYRSRSDHRANYELRKKRSQQHFLQFNQTCALSAKNSQIEQHHIKKLRTALIRKKQQINLYKEQLEIKQKKHREQVSSRIIMHNRMIQNLEYLLLRQKQYNQRLSAELQALNQQTVPLIYTAKHSFQSQLSSVSFSFYDKNQ